MNCMYCEREGKARGQLEDGTSPTVCDGCWRILQNPLTALPFLRGHMTLQLRGTMSEAQLKRQLDTFMDHLSRMKRPG